MGGLSIRDMNLEQDFLAKVRDIHRFSAIQSHLGWDQETQMPQKGARARGEILAWLATRAHELLTAPEFGQLLAKLDGEKLAPELEANVREMRRKYAEAVKLPSEFIAEFTKVRSTALVAWQDARSKSDFSIFAPHLKTIIDLSRKKIEYLGFEHTPYDVLLDEYERDMKVSDYDPLFAGLKARLVPLLKSIMASGVKPLVVPEDLSFSIEDQILFCRKVSANMGFDFEGGKMDVSTHPFCAGLWSGDTRFTTRFDEKDPFSCLYAVMHESGHGLYEQGLPEMHELTPLGQAVSLGVHESQSRLWENQIGRTSSFWQIALPWFKQLFPQIPDWSADDLNLIANQVKPDFIRVEADEVTYNLHVMIRYEIEKKIFNQDLEVEDIPQVWNQMFSDWFGLDVPSDDLGCLQDIHWSMGAFGYFPTYTLGNLYSAQLLESMAQDLGSIDKIIKSGDWSPMLEWLGGKIHTQGSLLSPSDLIKQATGRAPSPDAFVNYVEEKYSRLYGL